MKNFNEVGLPPSLIQTLSAIKFTTPTPVQSKIIPLALQGKDILGSAQTGTGKTGAFGIPLVAHLLNNAKSEALILLPTRELALQVSKALKQLMGNNQISSTLLIGGEDIRFQYKQLKKNPRLIVGTPGRINDHLNRSSLKLDKVDFLVLDEVDRMLDMGFGIQLEAIAKYLTSQRQTLMLSATLPKNIEKISNKYLNNHIRIAVDSPSAPAPNITQKNINVSDNAKHNLLIEELNTRSGSIIIFVNTKRAADNMAKKIKDLGHKSDALHGDLRQNKRTKVISNFHKQNYRILVATDVAARGLDIPHIKHVINYNLPQCPEDYIHRIGRTARAGASGEAVNFISPADKNKWYMIQKLIDPNAKLSQGNGNNRNKPNTRYNQRNKSTNYRNRNNVESLHNKTQYKAKTNRKFSAA